jgi:hypothetical protein
LQFSRLHTGIILVLLLQNYSYLIIPGSCHLVGYTTDRITTQWGNGFYLDTTFVAIAGAGPLVGPVLACQFGYFPGFIWVLVGAISVGLL